MIAVISLPPLPVLRERDGVRAVSESRENTAPTRAALALSRSTGRGENIRNHRAFLLRYKSLFKCTFEPPMRGGDKTGRCS